MGACRALSDLAPAVPKSVLQPLLPGVFTGLLQLLRSSTEETTHLVLATIAALVQVLGRGEGKGGREETGWRGEGGGGIKPAHDAGHVCRTGAGVGGRWGGEGRADGLGFKSKSNSISISKQTACSHELNVPSAASSQPGPDLPFLLSSYPSMLTLVLLSFKFRFSLSSHPRLTLMLPPSMSCSHLTHPCSPTS